MAAEQQVSSGNPHTVAANLTVEPNTSPASTPAYQTSPAYHLPFTSDHFAINTHKPTFGIQQPVALNNNISDILHGSYQTSRTVVPPSSVRFYDPTKPGPRSPLHDISAAAMVTTNNAIGDADNPLNIDNLSIHSLKRKAGDNPDYPVVQTPKRKATDSVFKSEPANLSFLNTQITQSNQHATPNPEGVQDHATLEKRNVGGRPKHAQPRQKKLLGPTRLRKDKPVAANVHMDIWQLVLPYCPLQFLFTASKISKAFRERLKYESLWKQCREWNHSVDMPGPLPGMKEWDYAILIEGLGCMGCGNKRTRRTYWAFRKRWCAQCLQQNTILESASSNILRQHPKMLDCIPHGLFDSWGHYESAGHYSHSDWHRSGHGQQRGYELTAITEQLREVETFLSSGQHGEEKTEDEVAAWYAPKLAANKLLMDAIQKLEDWMEKSSREKVRVAGCQKMDREKFYKERALTMDPPLHATALEYIPAYRRAINISKAPNERSWQVLLPKLMKERTVAETLIRDEQERQEKVEYNQKLSLEYTDILVRRGFMDSPEQMLVLKLADEVLSNLETEIPVVAIDDSDFVLLVLRAVREKYYRLDEAVKPRAYGKTEAYRLLLDDARMVYERRIAPAIEDWKDPVRSRAARLFKCPGCTRTDVNLRYTFTQVFCHLHEKHVNQIGDFSSLWSELLHLPVGIRFPWCRIEWPMKLPILAEHHVSNGRWNPNDNADYVLAPSKLPTVSVIEYPFEHRSVAAHNGPDGDQFVDNIIYAGSLLRHTPLMAKYQSQIALRFAMDKYALDSDDPPAMEELGYLDLARIRTGNYPLFDNFRCKACCNDPEPARNNKFINKCQPFGELAYHFKVAHATRSWVSEMLTLPTETELWHALTEPGLEAAMDVFNKLFPRDDADLLDPTLRGPLKAPIAHMYQAQKVTVQDIIDAP